LCLGFDGLYANGTVMDLCRTNGWKYLITFKEGSLPALWTDYQALLTLCPKNRKTNRTEAGAKQTFAWVGQLEHIDDQKRRHLDNAFECHEETGEKTKRFAWLTNWSVDSETVVALANLGGRCRWKIENEGFNIQKNGALQSGACLQHRRMADQELLCSAATRPSVAATHRTRKPADSGGPETLRLPERPGPTPA
jgi:hypothetical protein